MDNLIDLQKRLESEKFDDLCDKVADISEATGKVITLVETFDPKIRDGVLVKALVACIHDGLMDDEDMENIQNWLRSEYERYKAEVCART